LPTAFDSFAVGDVVVFKRSFSPDDFSVFSRLSGDSNPLHHDETHAKATPFGRTIVPLHLTLAPLSYIAGMVFPGEPSLYLGHQVRAANAVHYGETVTYSARIESVNAALRVLTLRVLVLRETDVIVDASMQVQASASTWNKEAPVSILHTAKPGCAVITGASGAIGGAIAVALASLGWALLLQDRGDGARRQSLRAGLDRLGAAVEFVTADLATASGRATMTRAVSDRQDVEAVIHAASPGLGAPLEQLIAVNYSAFRQLAAATVPAMLARQKGRLMLIGSTAMLRALPGWEDYAAAKTMVAGWVAGVDGRFSVYGVRGLVLMPGYVATRFSDDVRGGAPALLPQEVAAEVADMITSPKDVAVVVEVGRRASGTLGFFAVPEVVAPVKDTLATAVSVVQDRTQNATTSATVTDVIRSILHMPSGSNLKGGGLGITPGWDSLRQIEVILALESEFNIQFTSTDLAELTRFDMLLDACQRKISET
jgi:short-subunit dehydrogenase/acyl dehydratase/acyl carrier protein